MIIVGSMPLLVTATTMVPTMMVTLIVPTMIMPTMIMMVALTVIVTMIIVGVTILANIAHTVCQSSLQPMLLSVLMMAMVVITMTTSLAFAY